MKRDLRCLSDSRFDLCILGGGINGLAAAYDAALRGLSVALVEKGDFGGETSAGSLKILHGGLRYLQHLDFSRMTESVRERNALMRLAPHLVNPLGFLVPTTPGLMSGRFAMRTALAINDVVSWKRNHGITDPNLHLPAGRILSVEELNRRAPGLSMETVTGAALFYDAQMSNSDRYTLSFALGAAAQGAVLANRLQGIRFDHNGDRLTALTVRDLESGDEFEIQAAQFAAMTGPWRDLLPELTGEKLDSRDVVKNAGLQLVTRRGICTDAGLAVPAGDPDPDAHLKRGGRHYFSTPWRGCMLWGTKDSVYRGEPGAWRIREQDIEEFLGEINAGIPGLNLQRSEVTLAFGGLRLLDADGPTSGSKVARRYAIEDHSSDLGLRNLISMDGIKYTACRIMAEKAVNLVVQKLDKTVRPCSSAEAPLPGGNFDTLDALHHSVRGDLPEDISDDTVRLVAESYGSLYPRDLKTDDCCTLCDGVTPRFMVSRAVEQEMALHLEDMVLRRLPLGCVEPPSAELLNEVADLMAAPLKWDATRKEREIDSMAARFRYE